jgi:DnaJ-domain-containing protein 1
MAPRFPRRHRDDDDAEDPDDTVALDDDAHAWWAQRPVEDLWRPRADRAPVEEPERDVLAEHFGADWRTSFGFDPPPVMPDAADPEGAQADEELPDEGDAYAVLGVEATATWEEIVAAHRALARRHHPDRVASLGPEAVTAAEERIVRINAAYAELRIRRGR